MLLPLYRPVAIAARCFNGRRVLLMAAFILAGCTTVRPVPGVLPAPAPTVVGPSAPSTVVPGASASSRPTPTTTTAGRLETTPGPTTLMLAFADHARTLNGAELSAEIARMGDPGDFAPAQMQLAITLSATRVPADLARALGLLQRVIASQSIDAVPLQPLARTLASRYLEQRRVEDDRDRQVQQLREAQRRIDQLNDRLEALRAIERSVTRPNHPAAVVPAPATNGAKPSP